jgi:uncharacterized membrane protein YphA (DoxX/SURF4 family)
MGSKKVVSMKAEVCECQSCFATNIVRWTLGFVFVYYSITKLFFGAAPPVDAIITFMPADISLFLMGMFEFVLGTLLILGIFTRVAAWIAVGFFGVLFASVIYLHISGVYPDLWFIANMAKDVALTASALAVALLGAPCWSIDAYIKKKCM